MSVTIRRATPADEPFLWRMLFRAAHMPEDGETDETAAQRHPDLRRYAEGWGRATDLGVIAVAAEQPIGAAWVRLLVGAERGFAYIDDVTPELAIAVEPEWIGRGAGTAMLTALIEAARGRYPRMALSVRRSNPAARLYERLGFVVTGSATNRVGTRSLVMVRKLPG